jgi:hypothetical protein
MRVEDYFANGKRWWVRLHEKGGKRHEMLAYHKLEALLDEYIEAADIGDDGKSPLFRSALGRTGLLNGEAMHRIDAYRMIQRCAAELGLKVRIGCHTFRATGMTAYLEAGGPLENAQAMTAHESPRTTKLYDRTGDEFTLDEVERITFWAAVSSSGGSGGLAGSLPVLRLAHCRASVTVVSASQHAGYKWRMPFTSSVGVLDKRQPPPRGL